MDEEFNNYHYYEEGLEYLKKTIEKQRAEINGMKDKIKLADERVREVEINREATQMQY
jgi:prefoldin subunit 5